MGMTKPTLYLLGHELGAVIAADVLGSPTHREQVLQRQHHIPGSERSGWLDRQAFPCELVDDDQQLQLPAVFSPLTDEVVAPHVVAMRGPVWRTQLL